MNQCYHFGINGETIGPLGQQAIGDRITEGTITPATLAWCASMDDWKPVGEIAELTEAFGEALAREASPPPLPGASRSAASDPPPLPRNNGASAAGSSKQDTSGDELDPSYQVPQDLNGVGAAAYHVVFWLFRPWRGRPSLVRRFVRENPKRALPVAAGTLLGLFVLFCFAVAPLVKAPEAASPGTPPQQAPAMVGGGRNIYQPIIDAQRDNARTIDDVYRYNRDSFDQQCETYRRANYDWYTDND